MVELSVGRLLHVASAEHEEADATRAGDLLDVVAVGQADTPAAAPGGAVIDLWADGYEACRALNAQLRRLAADRDDVATLAWTRAAAAAAAPAYKK